MVTEYIQGGELWTYIYDKTNILPRSSLGGFTADVAAFYAANVIAGFHVIHSFGVAYRDLKV